MHCASLLRIISGVISARTLKNGGVFFTAGPRHRGKSSFTHKRVWWPIIFFCCFELNNKFLCVNKYGPILSVEQKAIIGNVNLASNRDLQSWCYYKDLHGYKQGAVAPKRTWGPPIFISKVKFLQYKQSMGKVLQKSQCRFYFSGMTLNMSNNFDQHFLNRIVWWRRSPYKFWVCFGSHIYVFSYVCFGSHIFRVSITQQTPPAQKPYLHFQLGKVFAFGPAV